MNWLLIVVIAIILASALSGYKKGFIGMAVSLIGTAVVLCLSAVIAPVVTEALIGNDQIYSMVYDTVVDNLDIEENVIKSIDEQGQEEIIDDLSLPQFVKDSLKKHNVEEVYDKLECTNFSDYIYAYVTRLIIDAISHVAVFILLAVIFVVTGSVIKIFEKIPVLKEVNKLFGLIVGVVFGLFLVDILLIILVCIPNSEIIDSTMKCIESSDVLTNIYEKNYLWNWIISR